MTKYNRLVQQLSQAKTALEVLRPGVFKEVLAAHLIFKELQQVPWLYLPIDYYRVNYPILFPTPQEYLYQQSLKQLVELCVPLTQWELTKNIYDISTELFTHVIDTPLNKLPVDTLLNIRDYCSLIVFPTPLIVGDPVKQGGEIEDKRFNYAFVHFDYSFENKEDKEGVLILYATLLTEDFVPYGTLLPLQTDDLDSCIQNQSNWLVAWTEDIYKVNISPALRSQLAAQQRELWQRILNIMLYINSDNADLNSKKLRDKDTVTLKNTKRGIRVKDSNPNIVNVGYKLRYLTTAPSPTHEDKEGTHRSPKAHLRRAHWHTYRYGEKRSKTKVRWISPILVNPNNIDDIPTIKKV